jgi:hypothetical protein
MAKSEIIAKVIIKVHLVNGEVIAHVYSPPTSEKEMKQFVDEIVDREKALTRGKIRFLYFENPGIVYNPDNVAGIELSTVGAEELKSALERAGRKAGFISK